MTDKPKQLSCDEAIRMLFEFLDNELEQHDHAAMEAHLNQCRGCFSRMEFDKRLKHMIKDADASSAPDELRERVKKITNLY